MYLLRKKIRFSYAALFGVVMSLNFSADFYLQENAWVFVASSKVTKIKRMSIKSVVYALDDDTMLLSNSPTEQHLASSNRVVPGTNPHLRHSPPNISRDGRFQCG